MDTSIIEAAIKWWKSLSAKEQLPFMKIFYTSPRGTMHGNLVACDIWINEVVLSWWFNKGGIDGERWRGMLLAKHSVDTFGTDEEIAIIYLKEHEGKEVSPLPSDYGTHEGVVEMPDTDKVETVEDIAEEIIYEDDGYKKDGYTDYINGKFNGLCDGIKLGRIEIDGLNDRNNKMAIALQKAVEYEEGIFKSNQRAADIHNNTDGVGQSFDYMSYPTMPKWVAEAKEALKEAGL